MSFNRALTLMSGVGIIVYEIASVVTNEITNQQTFSASESASGKARERRHSRTIELNFRCERRLY